MAVAGMAFGPIRLEGLAYSVAGISTPGTAQLT